MQVLPLEALLNIVLYLDMEDIARASQADLAEFLSREYVLYRLSMEHNLPIAKSIEQLLEYSKMEPRELAIVSAEKGDIRVIRAIYATVGISDYIGTKMAKAAAFNGHLEVIEFLLDKQVIELTPGISLKAAEGGQLNILEFIYDGSLFGFDYETKIRAVKSGNVDVVDFLLGKMILQPGKYRELAIIALELGHTDVTKFLLERMAELYGIYSRSTYIELMIRASEIGNIDIVPFTLLKSEWYNDQDISRAISKASRSGHNEIVRLLSNVM